MDTYRTEEEQIEAIKRWWQTNGSNVLIGIGLAIFIVVGWQFWQDQKRATGEAASVIYSDLLDAAGLSGKEASSDGKDNSATLVTLGEQLKADHDASEYAVFASLMLAKHYVNAGDAEKAESELRWAVDHNASQGVKLVAQLRLARVLALKGQLDDALSLIDSVDAGAQAAAFNEVKGDIYVRQEKFDEARAAYSKALNSSDAKAGSKPIVKMKYDNLAVVN
ncbi:hypothetical protein A9Q99_11310 [Gammaproteobacteria bacterium 45_16_T64]|nr:hypothetical protein A9Q99_11310 [Gammaproteobacteria bacterium 45_16_T64]